MKPPASPGALVCSSFPLKGEDRCVTSFSPSPRRRWPFRPPSPCRPTAPQAQRRYYRNGYYNGPTWRDSDGRYRCRRANGTTGLIVGGAAGALIGRSIDGGRNHTTGTIVGAVAGALVGREVQRSSSAQPLPLKRGASA